MVVRKTVVQLLISVTVTLVFCFAWITLLAAVSSAQTFVGVDTGPSGEGVGMSIARTNYSRAAYSHFSQSTNALRYTSFNGSAWITQSVDTSVLLAGNTALVMVGSDPRIVYTDAGRGLLKLASFNGSSWAIETIDSSGRAGGQVSATICGGYLCISYYDAVSQDLRFAVGSSGSWQVSTTDASTNDVGSMSSIASLPNGRPIIAYSDLTSPSIKIATQQVTGLWNFDILSYPGELMAANPSIAVAADGTVHVTASHVKAANLSGEYGLYYARKPVSGTWGLAKVSADAVGGATSLSLRADGTPEFAGRFAQNDVVVSSGVRVFQLLTSGLFQSQDFAGSLGSSGRIDNYDRIQLSRNFWGDIVTSYLFRSASPSVFTPRVHRVADTDGDGIPDHREGSYGTSVSLADTDGDGVSDGDEVLIFGTNPVVRDGTMPPPLPTPTPSPTPNPPPTVIPSPPPTASPSPTLSPAPTPDPRIGSPDTDGDGLTDADEAQRGTDPNRADTDGDGVSDGQEVTDGTNPLDGGSFLYVGGLAQCYPWTSRMGTSGVGVELNSLATSQVIAQITVRNPSGARIGNKSCTLSPQGRCAIDLSTIIPGRKRYKSASVCLYHNGPTGSVEGRITTGRVTTAAATLGSPRAAAATSPDRIVVLPLTSGATGDQFLSFGRAATAQQRAGSRAGGADFEENVLLLLNPESSSADVVVTFFNDAGRALKTQRYSLAANALREAPLSRLRVNGSGLIQISPTNPSQRLVASLVRVVQDGPSGRASDEGILVADGRKGSGGELELPVTSRSEGGFVEVANTQSDPANIELRVRSSDGITVRQTSFTLEGNRTRRLPITQLIAGRGRHIISLDSDLPGSIIAQRVVLEPPRGRARAREILVGAYEALGSVLRGGFEYNSRQATEISILNSLDEEQTVTVSTGDETLRSRTITLAPHALGVISINAREAQAADGSVIVLPAQANGVVAWISRRRGGDFSTIPLR